MSNKNRNRIHFEAAMAAYEELEGSGLLCSTESSSILARIKYKYKLSPLKYLSDKRNNQTNIKKTS